LKSEILNTTFAFHVSRPTSHSSIGNPDQLGNVAPGGEKVTRLVRANRKHGGG